MALRINAYTFLLSWALGAGLLGGCSMLPSGGPSPRAINSSSVDTVAGGAIEIVDVTQGIAGNLIANARAIRFADVFGDGVATGTLIGRGDVLDITIWEAPPAVLFGSGGGFSRGSAFDPTMAMLARSNVFPEQIVDTDGSVSVPFAGRVPAVGRSPHEIAADIQTRLQGKAHDPQVIVRLTRNAAADVTIVGDVAASGRMPLTAKGERLLDALASAGGVKQPVGKTTIQLTRHDKVEAMALEAVIRDPQQNIRLQAGDVVTLLFQPYSFTVLGAARSNQEIPFEGTGLTLSQALGRMGGLDDQRASPRGVFIFRFEDPSLLPAFGEKRYILTESGKIPVIYRVNMRDPHTLFVAQSFPIKDKDLLYVSNAPLADFSKFLQAVSQIVYPITTLQNANIF